MPRKGSKSKSRVAKKSLNRIPKRKRFQKKSKKRSIYSKKSLKRKSLKKQRGGWGSISPSEKKTPILQDQYGAGWPFRKDDYY